MSRTYIGPFGRLLPIPGDSGTPSPIRDSSPRMTAHQPLFLPLPTRLDFGSDPRPGFTDPDRYETMAGPQRSLQPSKAETVGTLPPLRQLLGPESPVGGVASSFPPHLGAVSPAERTAGYPTPRTTGYGRPQHARTEGRIFDVQHTSVQQLQPQHTTTTRQVGLTGTSTMQYPPTLQTYSGGANPMYANSPDESRQAWKPLPAHSDLSNYQWQTAQRPDRRSSPASSSMSGQSLREATTTTKPLLTVVGEKVVPGEGPCYIYEDGTYVRKLIDGEVVNAKWGVTKAGKPRRRLRIACLTCREKKIKCDPGEVKCVQCDKSGRECRFQTA